MCYFISQHYASRGGHVTVCAFLLETGACASPRTPAGATPLHRAAYCGHVDVVRLLLGRGADPTLCDDDGATALHKVHLPTDFTSFVCPADGGVTPSLSLSVSQTSLLQAAERGHGDVCQLLLQRCPALSHRANKRLQLPHHLARQGALRELLEAPP